MISRRETINLGQQPRLLQGRCDTCVHATAANTTTLPLMHNALHSDSPYTSLRAPFTHQSCPQSPVSRTHQQIQSP
jgi:hypothetical protein